MSLTPGQKHLVIIRGRTFSSAGAYGVMPDDSWAPPMTKAQIEAAWTPVNLTGYTAAAQGRARIGDTAAVWSLTSSPAAGITLGGVAGTFELSMTRTQTAALAVGSGVWDIVFIRPTGEYDGVIEGTYEIREAVTR